jgi:hypothetical protein
VLTGAAARRGLMLAQLTLRAWLGLVAFDLIVLTGFARAHTWVRRCRKRAAIDGPTSTDDVIWAVDEACVWYIKRAACLQRSSVATRLLRRRGWPAELVIGYRPTPFESHAWVEVAGVIVNDRPQYQKFFAVLERV